jgi:small subunit ribosomal protein S20
LANTKSAMKQARQNEKRRVRNRVYRTAARSRVKAARKVLEGGSARIEEAEAAIGAAVKSLDKAVQKGILHKNNAARRKARLFKLLRSSQQNP